MTDDLNAVIEQATFDIAPDVSQSYDTNLHLLTLLNSDHSRVTDEAAGSTTPRVSSRRFALEAISFSWYCGWACRSTTTSASASASSRSATQSSSKALPGRHTGT